MMALYPLPLTFDTSAGVLHVVIDRDGWRFGTDADRELFDALPTPERIALRGDLGDQVTLAVTTPKRNPR